MHKQTPHLSSHVYDAPSRRAQILAMRGLAVLVIICAGLVLNARQAQAQEPAPGCELGACVTTVRPQLLQLDLESVEIASAQSVLQTDPSDFQDALFSSLTGNTIALEVSDYDALMLVDFQLGALLSQLQTDLGLASPQAVLAADITLDQLFTALAAVSDDSAVDTALNKLVTAIDRTETIQLGVWLQDESSDGAISDVSLNLLDFVTGSIQLFNYTNVHTAPDPITIELGEEQLRLQALVVAPPLMLCGPAGSQFYSAAMRLAWHIEGGEPALDQVETPAGIFEINIQQTSIYVEIGRGQGVIAQIDTLNDVVMIEAAPGDISLYIGAIDDAVFFDRTRAIDQDSDLDYGSIGTVTLVPPAQAGAAQTFDLGYRSFAASGPITPTLLAFDPSDPDVVQTTFAGPLLLFELGDELVANVEMDLDLSSLGLDQSDLDDTLNSILAAVNDSLGSEDAAISMYFFSTLLGVDFGGMGVRVLGIGEVCPAVTVGKTHAGTFPAGATGDYTITVTNTGVITPSSPISVVDTLPPGFSYASHSGQGWNLEGTPGATVTLVNSTPLSPTSTLPPLVLTVDIAQNLTGTLTNTVTVTTTGNTNEDNTAIDPTQVIDADPDDDDDGVPDVDDPAPDDPCVPNPDAEACPSEPPPEGQIYWLPIMFHYEPAQPIPFRNR